MNTSLVANSRAPSPPASRPASAEKEKKPRCEDDSELNVLLNSWSRYEGVTNFESIKLFLFLFKQ